MKKKGFTLIELLAVIVILALVALITIPIITGIINSVRKKAFEDTVHGLIESANVYYTSHLGNINEVDRYEFDFDKYNGNTSTGEKLLFKGERPIGGTIVLYGNGDIAVNNITNGRYYATKLIGSNEIAVSTTSGTLTVDEITQKLNDLESKINDPKHGFIISHPVGSIYITVSEDENSVEAMKSKYKGTSWELYGPGRTLVNMGSNGTTNYATVGTTGGSSSALLTNENLPNHSHVIPSLSVSKWSASHTHTGLTMHLPLGLNNGTSVSGTYGLTYASNAGYGYNILYTGATSITVSGQTTTTSNTTTCTDCNGDSISTQNPYITVYMYKRTA